MKSVQPALSRDVSGNVVRWIDEMAARPAIQRALKFSLDESIAARSGRCSSYGIADLVYSAPRARSAAAPVPHGTDPGSSRLSRFLYGFVSGHRSRSASAARARSPGGARRRRLLQLRLESCGHGSSATNFDDLFFPA